MKARTKVKATRQSGRSLPALERRIGLLEARPRRMLAHERQRHERFMAAVRALFDTFEAGTHGWRPEPPYRPPPMDEVRAGLLQRLDDGTATDEDRRRMGALPSCHVAPLDLVRAAVMVCAGDAARAHWHR